MRVAVDAMGGAAGPGPIVAGAALAVRAEKSLRLTLVGEQALLEKCVADAHADHRRIEIHPASQVIAPDESLASVLRHKPDNSIVRCWQLLAERKVEALVSAGSLSAIAAAGLRYRHFLPNVRQPGVAAVIPTLKGPAVLIDAAANTSPTPAQLYQYGVMGTLYAQHLLQRESPRVALLSAGTEQAGRFERIRATLALFENGPLQDQFVGQVDSQDVHRGPADVFVSDGFVGGMLLNMWRGVFQFAAQLAVQHLQAEPNGEARGQEPHASPACRLGGAFLGVEGICLLLPPDADAASVCDILLAALQYLTVDLNGLMVKALAAGPLVATRSTE